MRSCSEAVPQRMWTRWYLATDEIAEQDGPQTLRGLGGELDLDGVAATVDFDHDVGPAALHAVARLALDAVVAQALGFALAAFALGQHGQVGAGELELRDEVRDRRLMTDLRLPLWRSSPDVAELVEATLGERVLLVCRAVFLMLKHQPAARQPAEP